MCTYEPAAVAGESANIQLACLSSASTHPLNLKTLLHVAPSSRGRQRCTLVGSSDTVEARTRTHSRRMALLVAHVATRCTGSRSRTSAAESSRVGRGTTSAGAMGITYRHVARAEITAALIGQINRREARTGHYVPRVAGPHATAHTGMRLVEQAAVIPNLTDAHRTAHVQKLRGCLDTGGAVIGGFAAHGRLVGLCGLVGTWLGRASDTLDMFYLFCDGNVRDAGVGTRLIELIKAEARQRGAAKMYISATNTKHTVDFYMRRGAVLAEETFEDEPNHEEDFEKDSEAARWPGDGVDLRNQVCLVVDLTG